MKFDEFLSKAVSDSVNGGEMSDRDVVAHGDHPSRHFDRTCAGCWAERAEQTEAELTRLRKEVRILLDLTQENPDE